MNSVNHKELKDLLRDITLNDMYAHIFIEYDQGKISLNQLIELIEINGTQVLEITELQVGPRGRKSILLKLDAQDVREVILNLSKYPLINLMGYNSKTKTNQTRRYR